MQYWRFVQRPSCEGALLAQDPVYECYRELIVKIDKWILHSVLSAEGFSL